MEQLMRVDWLDIYVIRTLRRIKYWNNSVSKTRFVYTNVYLTRISQPPTPHEYFTYNTYWWCRIVV